MKRRAVVLAVVTLAACSARDVYIADVTSDNDGGSQGGNGGSQGSGGGSQGSGGGSQGSESQGCADTRACGAFEYCEKATCAAPFGTCVPRPIACNSNDLAVECGCDGATYWNACVRQRAGVSKQASAQCLGSPTCFGSDASTCVASGAFCAQVFPPPQQGASPGPCSSAPGPGFCWVLPDMCPPIPFQSTALACGPTPVCEGLCEAIKSGQPHVAAPSGRACNP